MKSFWKRAVMQLTRIAAWFSQGVNCILLGGHQDQTVSARCYVGYRLRNKRAWAIPYCTFNYIFWILFKQKDHCLSSHQEDIEFAKEIILLEQEEVPNA